MKKIYYTLLVFCVLHLHALDVPLYLQNLGYDVSGLVRLDTNGATDCKYYILTTSCQKLFVKTGEKVNKEVENIVNLSAYVSSIPKLEKGSSTQDSILIEEFYPYKDYGFEMVNFLHSEKIDEDDFLQFQTSALNLLREFYQIDCPDQSLLSKVFDLRAQERISDLIKDEGSIFISGKYLGVEGEISLKQLIKTPIIYYKSDKVILFPNLVEMTRLFSEKIKILPKVKLKRILHGDFHPSNLTQDAQGVLHPVDLSDVMYGEDPTWDLGKWLNHVNRLHKVVSTRTHTESINSISFTLDKGFIQLKDGNVCAISMDNINRRAIDMFAEMIDEPSDLVGVRSAAAEFIVNISTLKRHINRFPVSTKTVLLCIIESYHNFNQKYDDYVKKNQ